MWGLGHREDVADAVREGGHRDTPLFQERVGEYQNNIRCTLQAEASQWDGLYAQHPEYGTHRSPSQRH